MPSSKKPLDALQLIDKIRDLHAEDRVIKSMVDWIDYESPFGDSSDIREFAEALSGFAGALDAFREAMEEWDMAEGAEDRRETKERALEALEEFLGAWDQTDMTELPEAIKTLVARAGMPDEDEMDANYEAAQAGART